MSRTKGQVTLPSETGFLKETQEMLDRWGADAIRDSDGTKLSDEIKGLDAKIYTTYFVSRGHNEHAAAHMDECQQIYLLSKYTTAEDIRTEIAFMAGYYREQVVPDYIHDPYEWWEVIDRTTDTVVPVSGWTVDQETDTVCIHETELFHSYTVSFLVYAIWDPTQMYNHITNEWGDTPHDIPFDVRGTASGTYAKKYLRKWLEENPETDVVRFTTFFYHFTLVFNDRKKEKFVDWFGYGASVSADALLAFEQEKGYRLRPEHLIQQGYYNTTFHVPSREYQDYMDFIQHFVAQKAKELVDIVHAADAGTAFSGDTYWLETDVVTKLRRWVYAGGGLIGVGEPSAVSRSGHFFQLYDVLGVDKEVGYTLSTDKYYTEQRESHFISADCKGTYHFGESMKNIYATEESTEIIEYSDGEIHLSAHDYGKGRGVYIAGLPYCFENTRLLLRSMYYAANQEQELEKWYADNIYCEVHAYPAAGKYAIVNNSSKPQKTLVYDGRHTAKEWFLQPCEVIWKEL